jgi:hypothetical protein
MSQSATLYTIAKLDFPKLLENPANFGLLDLKKEYVSFQKTHEGFCFILSKGQNPASAELVKQIFYPPTYVGEEINFENLDLEDLPEDFNFESSAVYYNDPGKVTDINTFLDTINIENFKELFNADELNEQGVYPILWNTETGEDVAFNVRHMAKEFLEMKKFFSKAKEEGDYVLSFVG